MGRQLIQGHPGGPEVPLEQTAVFYENHRLAAQQLPKPAAFQIQIGQEQFQSQNRADGHKASKQGNAVILHGDGGQIGNHDGHYKFRRFHLPDLPLAHEPDHQNHDQVQKNRACIG